MGLGRGCGWRRRQGEGRRSLPVALRWLKGAVKIPLLLRSRFQANVCRGMCVCVVFELRLFQTTLEGQHT